MNTTRTASKARGDAMDRHGSTFINSIIIALGSALLTFAIVAPQDNADDSGVPALVSQDQPQEPSTARPADDPMIDRVLEVAEEVDPAMADRLREICDADPQEFDRVMRQSGQRLMGLVRLKERDPQLYHAKVHEMRFERQAIDLAVRHCRAVKSGDIDLAADLELRLQSLLQTQMALKLKVRGDSINRLKEHVSKLEIDLEQDASKFSDVVEKRMDHLLKNDSNDCRPVANDA